MLKDKRVISVLHGTFLFRKRSSPRGYLLCFHRQGRRKRIICCISILKHRTDEKKILYLHYNVFDTTLSLHEIYILERQWSPSLPRERF